MPDVKPLPDDYPRVNPHLTIAGAAEAIDFYINVLGATERMRMAMPDGTVAHAEIMIGDSIIMIGDEVPGTPEQSPRKLGGTASSLYVYVEDVDAVAKRAEEAGAKILQPPADAFYGDRNAHIEDPFGHVWTLATHIEDVSPEEMAKRAAEAAQAATQQ